MISTFAGVRIRLAQLSDVPALPLIEDEASLAFRATEHAWVTDDAPTGAEDYPPLIANRTVWVAEDNDGLAGFVSAMPLGDGLHVLELAVRPDHQRRGIGRRLMLAVIEGAGGQGYRSLTLTTFRGVAFNAPFYETLGFEILAEPAAYLQAILDDQAARRLADRCAMLLKL